MKALYDMHIKVEIDIEKRQFTKQEIEDGLVILKKQINQQIEQINADSGIYSVNFLEITTTKPTIQD